MTAPLFGMLLLLHAPSAHAQRVWAEGNLATVLVGYDPATKAPVRRKLMLIALGPDEVDPVSHHDRYAACLKNAVVTVVTDEATWRPLDLGVPPWPQIVEEIQDDRQPVNVTTLQVKRSARVAKVSERFIDTRERYFGLIRSCGLPQSVALTARLAIVNRVCLRGGSNDCDGNDYLSNPDYSSASRYSKIFE